MKELFEDIKLSKIAYLLEKIEKQDIDGKVRNFRKLEQYKITKKIGLFLIKNSTRDYGVNDELGGINSSIIELCFKDYKKEYNKAIEEIFDELTIEAKDRVLFLLTTVADKQSLELYTDLILKYYKKRETIPIGQLIDKPSTYKYVFPKLYKVTNECTGCGICSKVCPVGNITQKENNKPVFKYNCESCLACANNCPQNAIQLKIQKSKDRFRNSEVTLNEIIVSNNILS